MQAPSWPTAGTRSHDSRGEKDVPFSEQVKSEAKRRANYTCVWCQSSRDFVEVHHMTPQNAGGSDDLDNAAPLCPNCHTLIGSNPDMRRQLNERRDWWWARCAGEAAANVVEGPMRKAEQFVDRFVKVALNLQGVTVNYISIRERDLEVHFLCGERVGISVVRWGPNELVADAKAIVRSLKDDTLFL